MRGRDLPTQKTCSTAGPLCIIHLPKHFLLGRDSSGSACPTPSAYARLLPSSNAWLSTWGQEARACVPYMARASSRRCMRSLRSSISRFCSARACCDTDVRGQERIVEGSRVLLVLHRSHAVQWPVPSVYRGGQRHAAHLDNTPSDYAGGDDYATPVRRHYEPAARGI